MKSIKNISQDTRTVAEFNYKDPFLIEDLYSEEEILIRNSTRVFAKKELFPNILEANRYEKYDKNLFKKLGSLGLLGSQIKGYGCSGVSSVAYGLIAREIEYVDSAYRSCFSV